MASVTQLNAVREVRPRLVVFGVGGAGGNAVNNMIASDLDGVHFVVANTDAQALEASKALDRIQLGPRITEGLGAGARPDVGARAAEDSLDEIRTRLDGAHMVFITAGMGGGTGTGAAPVVARIARDMGVLTVAVVTKPFSFEGTRRMASAEEGVAKLSELVDTLIVIPNQNLFRIIDERTPIAEAFRMADDVLHSGVRGVTDLMTRPGLINLDFADVRTVMDEMGAAMMGTGEAAGERRAVDAAHAAITNPLLDDISLKGARGVLINITGGHDVTLYEVDAAANEVRAEVDPNATVIVGSALDEGLADALRVSVLATGLVSGPRRVDDEAPGEWSLRPRAALSAPPEPPRPPEPSPRDEPAHVEPEPLSAVDDEPRAERGGRGLFGRRRKPAGGEEHDAPEPAEPAAYDEDADEEFDEAELDIPAFLRRHAG